MENNYNDFFSDLQNSEKYQKGDELIKQGIELQRQAFIENQNKVYYKQLINTLESFKKPFGFPVVYMTSFFMDTKMLSPMDMETIVNALKEKLKDKKEEKNMD